MKSVEILCCSKTGGGEGLLLWTLELELVSSELGPVVDLTEVFLLFPVSDAADDFTFLFLVRSSSGSTVFCGAKKTHFC